MVVVLSGVKGQPKRQGQSAELLISVSISPQPQSAAVVQASYAALPPAAVPPVPVLPPVPTLTREPQAARKTAVKANAAKRWKVVRMWISATIMPRSQASGAAVSAALLALAACGKPAPGGPVGPPDPACALAGLERAAVPFTLETTEGTVRCTLDAARAPRAAAMIVALAEGRAAFRDRRGEVSRRPYFEDMSFFRAIAGGLLQTGCAVGDGSGHPGYRIEVESDPSDAARLKRPGALLLARYTAPPNRVDPHPPPPGQVIGTQLVIGLTDMSHLAGKVTVLGACEDLEVARRLADRVAHKERKETLLHARVGRAGPAGGPCP